MNEPLDKAMIPQVSTTQSAQRLLDLHRPQFLHDADTLLHLNYPQAKITRRPVLVDGRIHVGYLYRIKRGFLRFEEATAFGLVSAP